nr:transmembrane protease serine 11B-like protein [Aotus nancymaae]
MRNISEEDNVLDFCKESIKKFTSRPVIASRTSVPLWMIALLMFGVLAIFGMTIGLLVHFLAVANRIYLYQGSFKVLDIPYYRNNERETSPENNYLSKILETRMHFKVLAFTDNISLLKSSHRCK